MQIKAAVKKAGKEGFAVESVELESPRDDEVLVKIAGVGICHTDMVFAAGELIPLPTGEVLTLPAVLGHEGSGIVEAVGSAVSEFTVGDRVAMSFRSCGECERCESGDAPYCRSMPYLNYVGRRTDGSAAIHDDSGDVSSNFFGQSSFADYALTYERNLVKVPDDFPLELAGPLGCGIQTGVGGVINSLQAGPGSSILITGGGPVGLSAVMGAKIQNCQTIMLLEPQRARRELAVELGATHTLDPADVDSLPEAVRAILPEGVDYALEATGIPAVQESIMDCLGSKAVFGMVGVAPPDTPMPGTVSQVMMFGHTVKGIVSGDSDPKVFIPEMMAHYRAGRLPFDRMITTFPLSQINEAIKAQHDGACIKAVLIPD